ncbi:4-hydroxythreonine-4-phosphate dehydrogenase PdxA [Pedobacter aquae]|uniref:4-hydroxythreonine-4-phosphate dehydrogenase PdxA n=1 Tax=Pedobacter aquae TaxID=2605747 RepID=A0A5C0VKW5_9SPHI|nr:4-hydroxythreonine-4-phosphate dehydrogenase PdxA [Pedobacter aquae]QEK52787.1 4-hydroxythreonine-4-phosphate dehydrogenase PdxA [Pedobacter aquae]
MSEQLKIGISIGDVNGIGLEVIIKTLMEAEVYKYCTPIVYGHTKVASFHRKAADIHEFIFQVVPDASQAHSGKPNMINCWEEDVKIELGVANEIGGKYALLSLKKATDDLVSGKIDALVTAPINKHNIQSEEFKFPGHTEFIQEKAGGQDALMFMISENFKVGVVTGHIPVKDIASHITVENIVSKLKLMNQSLKNDFWVEKPKIAVLGLNPHAGDNGLLGKEEQEIIIPAIEAAAEAGVFAFGPFPADGFFGNQAFAKFDAVLAMYHDQGLIPFKSMSFNSGVNFTAGLPVVRTSPDHGTGYDIAGKNLAVPASFREALFAAIHIVKSRREQAELTANTLAFSKMSRDRD